MASIDTIGGGNIEPRGLEEEMRSAYLDYAMSVIVGRALPDVRDGLKPVHRRVLYAMNELGAQPAPQARQVRDDRRRGDGEVPPARRLRDLRHARPDGAGLLDALPADRRPRELRQHRRLVGRRRCGTPRRGSTARDGAAARHRSGDGRLRPNFDGSKREPLVLPARFPNLLVNGSSGIAVGMATNIPPHNLREVISATIAYIDDPAIESKG